MADSSYVLRLLTDILKALFSAALLFATPFFRFRVNHQSAQGHVTECQTGAKAVQRLVFTVYSTLMKIFEVAKVFASDRFFTFFFESEGHGAQALN